MVKHFGKLNMKPLCIYHGGCDDGFASAFIINEEFNGDVEFHYGVYQKAPPDCKNRDVILVDFSYKRSIIDRIASEAKTVLILDHHKSAAEDLAGLPHPLDGKYSPVGMLDWQRECNAPNAVHALFDMNRSGAAMTWDYFNPDSHRPWLIDYIQDRDLWLKKLPHCDEIIMALRSYPQEFDTWADIIEGGQRKMIDEGISIHRYYRTIVESLKQNAVRGNIGGYNVLVVNSPFHFASELAGELAEDEPFAACYWNHAHGTTYSLRSRKDGIDVSKIAEQYGGGGHRCAAGFKVFEPLKKCG